MSGPSLEPCSRTIKASSEETEDARWPDQRSDGATWGSGLMAIWEPNDPTGPLRALNILDQLARLGPSWP